MYSWDSDIFSLKFQRGHIFHESLIKESKNQDYFLRVFYVLESFDFTIIITY